ncbi:toll-like receptor 2 [Ptychodera flava]|uniref:toll-like receptor 2 n=1 Tax=Ptychodera flava TaxID=63121 RepID=UPI00396A84E7
MRFAYFHIKLRLGGYQLQINDEEQPINKRYDAFVVYNQHDSDWVIHELVPHLENIDPPNFKLCIHERDFLPGYDIFENILDSIEQSKKTMLILSPDFAASEWCYFEMRMAQSCLFEEKRDIIVRYH